MKINQYSEHLQVVLRKMCEIVNADPDSIDFSNDKWFYLHQWTVEQEQEFIKWLSDYLYETKGARQEFLTHPYKNKKNCEKAAREFTWNYGWKTIL